MEGIFSITAITIQVRQNSVLFHLKEDNKGNITFLFNKVSKLEMGPFKSLKFLHKIATMISSFDFFQ